VGELIAAGLGGARSALVLVVCTAGLVLALHTVGWAAMRRMQSSGRD
jgi:hypothetical protein